MNNLRFQRGDRVQCYTSESGDCAFTGRIVEDKPDTKNYWLVRIDDKIAHFRCVHDDNLSKMLKP